MRDTRFTVDVLEEAVRRLNAAKDEVTDPDTASSAEGVQILESLGWAPMGVAEIAMDEAAQVKGLGGDSPVITAFLDGVMLGAICADVTYERALGLVTS